MQTGHLGDESPGGSPETPGFSALRWRSARGVGELEFEQEEKKAGGETGSWMDLGTKI